MDSTPIPFKKPLGQRTIKLATDEEVTANMDKIFEQFDGALKLLSDEYNNININNWQPIETAPKDGTKVLVVEGEQIYIASYKYDGNYNCQKPNIAWCISDAEDLEGFERVLSFPTHWMPLPLPPEM